MDAVEIFAGPTLEQQDEPRGVWRGPGGGDRRLRGVLVTAIYADRDEDERRIISAWESTGYEKRAYTREIRS